jgi:hypothetical protein
VDSFDEKIVLLSRLSDLILFMFRGDKKKNKYTDSFILTDDIF